MSKNAMAGAVTLCGVGLCMIGGAQLLQSGEQAHAAGAPAAAAMVASVANAQASGEPTVVWYSTESVLRSVSYQSYLQFALFRAWSDGRVEMRLIRKDVYYNNGSGGVVDSSCNTAGLCASDWMTVNNPSSGYKAAADINADELVDGADLASLLSNWGDAPRVPFPPSDCPLNLLLP